ncbi:MAG: hypothetical protein A2X58_14145 [Nitrospirae bacterium GWC2_56_14]|nr:MAG: hypothetical protein A2X58_14145 [Nitrospirae bacterium GWC2_56_14]
MPGMGPRFLLLAGIACFLFVGAIPTAANDPFLLNDYALELLKKQEYEKALEHFQKAFNMFPYNATLKRNLAEAYSYVGKRQLERNAYDEAADTFDHARELFPDEGKYGVMRGIALYSAKNYDAALFELERARHLGEETVETLFFLGRIHYDTGNLPGALEVWGKAQTIDPSNRRVADQLEKARRESKVEGGMDRGYSSRFSISHDVETRPDLADDILEVLEEAYNRVGSDLSHFPSARIPVILYTRKDYRSVTNSPGWSAGLYDGKIRLPVGGATEVSPLLKAVLYHEYTHVVVHELTAGHCPTWLNEGLAELEERKVRESPSSELTQAARQNGFIPFGRLEGSFSGFTAQEAVLAYQQSFSLVDYMISAYGWYKVRDVLVNLGKGMNIGPAMGAALHDFGLDYVAVVEEWRSFVQKKFGR